MFFLIMNALLVGTALGASFDCSLAEGFVETTLCADKALSKLDTLLASAYQQAIDEADQPAQVVKDQKAWLKKTRSACKSAVCLKQAYTQRIKSLALSKKFFWKTYVDKVNGIQFIYPSNRTIHPDKNNLEIHGFLMPEDNAYLIRFAWGNGDFSQGIKQTGIFEERKKGEWVAAIGRFEYPLAEKIAGANWTGFKAHVTCGISDRETGFHAAAGECLWALISDGKQYLVADTLGLIGLDENTLKTLMSIKLTDAKP